METLLEEVRQAKPEEIGDIFLTALQRYRELFPQWQIEVLTVDKTDNRNGQLDRIIEFAERLKE